MPTSIVAQNNKTQDVLLLKNGNKINGYIIKKTDNKIKIRLVGGSEINYELTEIKKVSQQKFQKNKFLKKKQDVLHLNNGDKINGDIVQKIKNKIKIRLADGSEVSYELTEIKEVSQGNFYLPIFSKKQKGILYLNNGDKVNGYIIQKTEEAVKVRLYNNSEIIYSLKEVKDISRNAKIKPKYFKVKEAGYYNTSTIGFNFNNSRAFQSINGYRFNPYIAIGLGIDIRYRNNPYNKEREFIIGVFPSISGDFIKTKRITPTYAIEPICLKNANNERKFYHNYSLGLKIRTNSNFDFVCNLNYQNIQTRDFVFLRTGISF